MARKEKDPNALGMGKIALWSSRGISKGCNLMVIGYLSIYCTSILGINAMLLGTLLLVSKLIDGVTDIVAGYLVDRTKTKIGRGRPYEIAIVGLWVATVFMFTCPASFSMVAKCIWVLVMYAMVNSVFATLLNACETPYMVRAFNNASHYVKLTSFGGLMNMLAVVIVNILLPILMGSLATSQKGWTTMILIFAVPLTAVGILRFLFIPEKYDVDATTEKINFKEVFEVLRTNKNIYIIAMITFVINLVSAMGIGQYYYTYIVKNISLMSLGMLAALVVLPLMPILPTILKKVTIRNLIMFGLILSAAGYVLNWFAYDNIVILVIAAIIAHVGVVPSQMLAGLMIIDCADYNEWQGKPRMEATLSVVPNLGGKIASAFGSFLLGVCLNIGGFISTTEANMTIEQPDSALLMLRLLMSFIPMAFYLLAALVSKFYSLDKIMPQVRKENEERRAARAADQA